MKNILDKLMVFTLIFLCISCMDEGLGNLNEDTKNATKAEPGTFFSNATKELADNIHGIAYRATGPGVTKLWAQHLTAVTYLEGATYIPEFSWTTLYRDVLKDLDESSTILSETEQTTPTKEKEVLNKQAMIEILKIYTYTNLVEAYGDIPYSEALDFNNPTPKYDDAQTVYLDLIDRLNSAISNLDVNVSGFSSADLIYNGNISNWIKFGNSLKLRMGMRIIDIAPEIGSQTVSEASKGVIESNEENAVFRYLSEYPNTNPWWNFLVRENLKYYVATNTFMDELNTLNDPRRSVFFMPLENGKFKGAEYGVTQDYFSFSREGEFFRKPDLAVIFIDYEQVEFLLAEAAERGITGVANAEYHYNKAIKASFDYYDIPENVADEYLAQPNVNYSSAGGSWQEKIGIQKWIALFDQGFEAWTEYRRLDYPKLSAPKEAESDIVPLRFLYPIDEQTLNNESYDGAANAIGGDSYSTRLFWDVQ